VKHYKAMVTLHYKTRCTNPKRKRVVCTFDHQWEKQSSCGVPDLPSIISTCDTKKKHLSRFVVFLFILLNIFKKLKNLQHVKPTSCHMVVLGTTVTLGITISISI